MVDFIVINGSLREKLEKKKKKKSKLNNILGRSTQIEWINLDGNVVPFNQGVNHWWEIKK